jgi:hypothetical protein
MRDLTEKKSRYLRDDLTIRLGNLASNLAHISSFAKMAKNPNAVEKLLDESIFFIEWTAAEAELDMAAELVQLQVQLSGWYHQWKDDQTNPVALSKITQQSRVWSDRVLDLSGLLQKDM